MSVEKPEVNIVSLSLKVNQLAEQNTQLSSFLRLSEAKVQQAQNLTNDLTKALVESNAKIVVQQEMLQLNLQKLSEEKESMVNAPIDEIVTPKDTDVIDMATGEVMPESIDNEVTADPVS